MVNSIFITELYFLFSFLIDMDESSFYGALKKIGGISDHKNSSLLATLYKSEIKGRSLQQELSSANIEQMEQEIKQLEQYIRETAANNDEHQRRISSCAKLLGSLLVKPQFAEHFRLKQLIEKYKRTSKIFSQKVEENRNLLRNPQSKSSKVLDHNYKSFLNIINDYLNIESKFFLSKQEFEDYEVDSESLAFTLVDEINEYQNCAKKLNINFPDFDPTKAISGIFETDQLSDDSYD